MQVDRMLDDEVYWINVLNVKLFVVLVTETFSVFSEHQIRVWLLLCSIDAQKRLPVFNEPQICACLPFCWFCDDCD